MGRRQSVNTRGRKEEVETFAEFRTKWKEREMKKFERYRNIISELRRRNLVLHKEVTNNASSSIVMNRLFSDVFRYSNLSTNRLMYLIISITINIGLTILLWNK